MPTSASAIHLEDEICLLQHEHHAIDRKLRTESHARATRNALPVMATSPGFSIFTSTTLDASSITSDKMENVPADPNSPILGSAALLAKVVNAPLKSTRDGVAKSTGAKSHANDESHPLLLITLGFVIVVLSLMVCIFGLMWYRAQCRLDAHFDAQAAIKDVEPIEKKLTPRRRPDKLQTAPSSSRGSAFFDHLEQDGRSGMLPQLLAPRQIDQDISTPNVSKRTPSFDMTA